MENMPKIERYILIGTEPVPVPDLIQWAKWMENSGDYRVVQRTTLKNVLVSTVFLGLDHQFGDGPPLLFETMVFGLKDFADSRDCARCSTYDEALKQHEEMVEKYK